MVFLDPGKYSAQTRRNANAHRRVRNDFTPSPIAIRAASKRARHPPQNRRSVLRVHYGPANRTSVLQCGVWRVDVRPGGVHMHISVYFYDSNAPGMKVWGGAEHERWPKNVIFRLFPAFSSVGSAFSGLLRAWKTEFIQSERKKQVYHDRLGTLRT